ncbi:MAG: hypothetical protein ACAI35_04370 [Candidatus Methylacidiphilales bacterium]|nr:hypothetical protein [Candidatus Methylacidiphilales bacterium]
MVIKVNNFTLADGVNMQLLTGPSGLQINGVDMSQQVPTLRASSMRFLNRGNRLTTVSFTVMRKHADLLAAERWMLEHERDLPRDGVITLTAKHPTNGYEISLFMAEAMVMPQSTYLGISTRHSYTITGGELVSTKPS